MHNKKKMCFNNKIYIIGTPELKHHVLSINFYIFPNISLIVLFWQTNHAVLNSIHIAGFILTESMFLMTSIKQNTLLMLVSLQG